MAFLNDKVWIYPPRTAYFRIKYDKIPENGKELVKQRIELDAIIDSIQPDFSALRDDKIEVTVIAMDLDGTLIGTHSTNSSNYISGNEEVPTFTDRIFFKIKE